MLDSSIYNLLGRGVKSFQDYDNEALQYKSNLLANQLQQAQVDELPLRKEMLGYQLQGAQIGNEKAKNLLGILNKIQSRPQDAQTMTGGDAIAANGGSFAGANPALVGQPRQTPQGGGSANPFGLTYNDVVALKAGGGPDLTTDYKLGLEGVSHHEGDFVTLPNGQQFQIPKLGEGMRQNGDGSIGNIPGAVDAAAARAGAIKSAEMRGTNQNTLAPLDRVDPNTGRPYNMTTAQLIDAVSPQPGSNLSGVPISGRLAVTADAANRGVPMGATTVNGQSGPTAQSLAPVQQELDAAKSGGPEALAQFQMKYLPKIMAIQDPQARAKGLQGFYADMQTPAGTPLHSLGAAPGGFSGFAGPTELAGAKAGAEAGAKADVELRTKPVIDYKTKVAENAADYKGKLDEAVSSGQDLMARVQEGRDALAKFTPGMGAETRLQLARLATSMGAPKGLVDRINNGDVSSKQEFMKLSAQTAMEALKQSLGGSGRITQAEFSVFQKNNPNIELDPNAITKIYDFTTRMYQKTLAEQQGYSKYVDQGGDPAKWRSKFAASLDPTGSGQIGVKPAAAGKQNDPLGLR